MTPFMFRALVVWVAFGALVPFGIFMGSTFGSLPTSWMPFSFVAPIVCWVIALLVMVPPTSSSPSQWFSNLKTHAAILTNAKSNTKDADNDKN